jgi:hypothetical protein
MVGPSIVALWVVRPYAVPPAVPPRWGLVVIRRIGLRRGACIMVVAIMVVAIMVVLLIPALPLQRVRSPVWQLGQRPHLPIGRRPTMRPQL